MLAIPQIGQKPGRQKFLAFDRLTKKQVILNLLTFSADFEWNGLKLFEQEIETLKIANHPAISKYLDSFELDISGQKGFVLVQSYIAVPSLEDYLQNGRQFSELDVKHIVRSLLEILRDLHDQNPPIIHQNIKPSNILLTDRSGHSNGQVYLIDFGLVQLLASQVEETVASVRTRAYMPPEQLEGTSSPASDLYSVGVTAIALLTRTHPADLPQENLYIQFESFTSISSAFTAWLRQITEPHLSQRFTSAYQALDMLAQFEPARHSLSPSSTRDYIRDAIQRSVVIGIKASVCIVGPLVLVADLLASLPLVLERGMLGVVQLVLSIVVFSLLVLIAGTICGSTVGVFNGLIVGLLTQSKFESLSKPRLHYITVSLISSISIALISWCIFTASKHLKFDDFYFLLVATPFFIVAAGSIWLSNHQLIQKWYERKL